MTESKWEWRWWKQDPPDRDGDGDVWEGLGAAGVIDNVPNDPRLQQLPLAVRDVVGEVHVGRSVRDVHLCRAKDDEPGET